MNDTAGIGDTHRSICPLCEGMCGIVVKTEGDKVTSIRPDPDNAWSKGHMCPKGTTLGDLHHDPDRIRAPMIRMDDGWHEVSWDRAFERIEELVSGVRAKYGQQAIAGFTGNMSGKGFSSARYTGPLHWLAKFGKNFSSSTVDQIPKNVSCHLMYGSMWHIPIPDVDRTDLFVIMGGNPAESKGSILSHRDVMAAIRAIRQRGGKVIVIDPVRTRTAAAADEWIGVKPGGDAALLLGVINVLFREDRVKLGAWEGLVNGIDALREAASRFTPERVESFSGVPADTIVALARQISDAPSAAVYGRIGTCTQLYGTLASWLVDAVAILTGNLDRPGGSMWSTQVAPHYKLSPALPPSFPVFGQPSRVRGTPSVLGQYPAVCMAEEIDTPGEGQIKALLTLGGNPVISVPGSDRLAQALPMLECMVSLDIYINETTAHAHVILPSPSLLQQPHWDVWAWPWSLTSGGVYSPASLPAPTDRPPEFEVMLRLGAIFGGDEERNPAALDDRCFARMCDSVGVGFDVAAAALPDRGPERVLDLCIRSGPLGDRFGENPGGLTLDDFKKNPDGVLLGPAVSKGGASILTPSGKIELSHPHFLDDLARLEAAMRDEVPSLLLVSRRQLRSLNSWMHNLHTLVKGKERCTLQIHPRDAEPLGIAQGDMVMVEGPEGQAAAPAEITEDIRQGVVCLPHGWGHDRDGLRMAIAAAHPGYNINQISPAGMVDPASGNAVCNGIPVSVRLLEAAE